MYVLRHIIFILAVSKCKFYLMYVCMCICICMYISLYVCEYVLIGCAINAIKFAVMRNKACCEKLIDVGGLKYVFSLLAGKGVKKALKRKGSGENRCCCLSYHTYIHTVHAV